MFVIFSLNSEASYFGIGKYFRELLMIWRKDNKIPKKEQKQEIHGSIYTHIHKYI